MSKKKEFIAIISEGEKVLVLSAFPFFLIEYFGEEFFIKYQKSKTLKITKTFINIFWGRKKDGY